MKKAPLSCSTHHAMEKENQTAACLYKHHGECRLRPYFDVCQAEIPENMKMGGVSSKTVLEGSEKPVRQSLLLEMGYARAIRTNTHKYIAVRYPEEIENQIAEGKKFKGF